MADHWSNKYIGIPLVDKGRDFDGCDCWGLVRLVMMTERQIELPSYDDGYIDCAERREISHLINQAKLNGHWIEKPVADEFDLVVFRRGKLDAHVGIVIDQRLMLHMESDDCAKVSDYANGRLKHQLIGIYRYAR